ncbi:hypothetical protein [Desertibaculum subflavum]|uniref:hypothetical protein n=1 Tax=Desertibaculum subflavum TaxID=2268458 RepID=UPI0034D2DE11
MSGLLGGMTRLGWPLSTGSLAELHGPLLISGMFGTLIGLERAIALGRPWAFACPAAAGLGTLALLAGLPLVAGAALYVIAAVVLVAASVVVARSQPTVFHGAMILGAIAWLAGNVFWLSGQSVPEIVGWWLAFPILTVAGERLELSRVLIPTRRAEWVFLLGAGLLLAGAQNALVAADGAVLFGTGLVLLTSWLLPHDIARRNVRQRRETRFFAVCMLCGYGWLGGAGLLLLLSANRSVGLPYDVAIHAVLIGFALSMVFGHALIILPAITRRRIQYHGAVYVPLLLLQTGTLMRVCGGLVGHEVARLWSGPVVLLAIAGLAAVVFDGARKSGRRRAQLWSGQDGLENEPAPSKG